MATKNLAKKTKNPFHAPLQTLSPRQRECANLLLQGMKYREIGKALKLSIRTVESYFNNIKKKFKCHNRTELIIKLIAVFKKTR